MQNRKFLFQTSLQVKVLFFIFVLLLLALSLSSFFYIKDFQEDFIEAVEWRSVSLAQSLIIDINARQNYLTTDDIFLNLETAYLQCKKLYDANKEHHISFISVLDMSGRVAAHSDRSQHGKTVDEPLFFTPPNSARVTTIRRGDIYHTLIPIKYESHTIGTVDIGFPSQIVDQRISSTVKKTATASLLFFLTIFVLVWLTFRNLVQKPVFSYIEATNDIAKGNLYRAIPNSSTLEFSQLSASLVHMRDSIRNSFLTIQEKNEEVKALIACSPVALFSVDLYFQVAIWTSSAEKLFGWTEEEIIGKPLPISQAKEGNILKEIYQQYRNEQSYMGQELQLSNKDGTFFYASVLCAPIKDSIGQLTGFMMSVENINERIERERTHNELQDQLTQAQKMESIGRLAGGVAHDYNNMLGVIIGNTELSLLKITADNPAHQHLNEILKAALHSADITKQLLAFARKQTITPHVIDLNKCIEQTLQMLGRLLGENIKLEWLPCKEPCMVNMDVTQVDQILANLCINAKDALPDGGAITIQTSKKEIDEHYNLSHSEAIPGQYICVSISDNGIGMDKDVREKIFEPFFTTKGLGEGTGLGLATVYGIIKQNHGFINVYSEPGKGTTFNIYVSEHKGKTTENKTKKPSESYIGNGETILLIEDESTILTICKQMLELLNYQVLATTDTANAISLAQENRTDIKLLISDVVLKNLSGPEICNRIRDIIPELKTLYMSGYTANIIANQGILSEDLHFIQKPFTQQKLAEMVWKALHDT